MTRPRFILGAALLIAYHLTGLECALRLFERLEEK